MRSKTTGKRLTAGVIALLLSVALLIGTTLAWFTDSVVNTGNRIEAGTLKIDLLMDKTGDGSYESIAGGTGDIFGEAAGNGVLWEPGKTEIVYLAVKNLGSLAVRYNIALDVLDGDVPIADALEYAVVDGAKAADLAAVKTWDALTALPGVQTGPVQAGRTIAAPNGTLDEIVNGTQDETQFFALAVHMKESADNAYQNGSVTIDVAVTATQAPAEADGFGSTVYDAEAVSDVLPGPTGSAWYQTQADGAWVQDSFADALASVYAGGTIKLTGDVVLTQTVTIAKDVTITSADPANPGKITCETSNHGYLLTVNSGANLTLRDIVVDGGSETGISASRGLIAVGSGASSTGTLTLEDGAVLRNNNNVTHLGAGGGVVLIAGSVTMNGGRIEGNRAYCGAGVAVVSLSTNIFTMKGGEISGNTSTSSSYEYGGGAVYMSAGTFVLNGGKLQNNTASYGGAVYAVKTFPVAIEVLSGTVSGNSARCGGAFYLNQCEPLTLAGGTIEGNTATNFAGGLLVAPDCSVVLPAESSIRITGNTSGSTPVADNLYLDGYKDAGIVYMPSCTVEGALGNAQTGISTWLKPDAGGTLLIAQAANGYAVTDGDLAGLTSDSADYALKVEGGNIVMVQTP